MSRHLQNRAWRFAPGTSNPCIVEQDDITIECEAICNRGIPVVYIGVEVLKEKQREFSAFAEPAIGKSNSVGFNESCRRGFMRIAAQIGFFLLSVFVS